MDRKAEQVSRRRFMRRTASMAMAAGGLTILGASTASGKASKTLKAGVVGCGGRGRGAMGNCVAAGKQLGIDVKVTAVADVFPERVDGAVKSAKRFGSEVPKSHAFVGFDAYKKVMDTDIDILLTAAPPSFRPSHFEAAVKAGKHVFMEKPVAVDPAGCVKMYALGGEATKKKLAVMPGTCLRHDTGYAGSRQQIADGLMGRVLGGTIYYCTGRLGFTPRREGWSDLEYMVRNWKSFVELSGDHIVEQHVHTIDMLLWIMGAAPVAAVANGGRARRQTGNMFDNFSIDFEFPGHVHIHSISRQINGCWSWGNGLALTGDKGWLHGTKGVALWDGTKPPMPKLDWNRSMYVQEHVIFLDSIVKGNPYNDTKGVTDGSLASILGRMAAYTGQRIEWQQLVDPKAKKSLATVELKPTPADFEAGTVKAPPDDVVPIPGRA